MFNHTTRRLRSWIMVLVLILALMSMISLSLAAPSHAADSSVTPNADEVRSLYWAASARLLDKEGDREGALALALEANRIPNPPDQAVRALEDLAYAPGPRQRYAGGSSAAFSPDGKQVAIGSDDIHLFDVESGQEVRKFTSLTWAAVDTVFSPDGSKLAGHYIMEGGDVSGPPQLIMWDVKTGNRLWPEDGYYLGAIDAEYNSPIFTPDSRFIMANDGHGHLIERDVNTGAETKHYQGKYIDNLVSNIAISPDGSRILAANDYGDVLVWDAQSGEEINRFTHVLRSVDQVAFSADGASFLVAGDHHLVMRDVNTGDIQHTYWSASDMQDVTGFFVNTEGNSFFTRMRNGDLIEWEIETGDVFSSIHTHATILNMSVDRQHLLVQSPNRQMQVWDVQYGAEARRYKGNAGVTGMAFSPDGYTIAAAYDDKEFTLWNADSGQVIFSEKNGALSDMVFNADGTRIATLTSNGTLRLWDVQTGQNIQTFYAPTGFVVFSPDGRSLLTAGSKKDLALWDIESDRQSASFVVPDVTGWDHATFSPYGKLIFVVDQHNTAYLFDVASRRILRQFTVGSYAMLSPDGSTIIFEAENHDMVFTDVGSGKEIRRISSSMLIVKTAYQDYYPSHIVISPDGKQLLTGGWNDLTVRDIQTGRALHHFAINGQDAVFSADGRFVLTKTDDLGEIYVDFVGHDLLLLRLDSPAELIQWTLANRAVATLDCDQRAYYGVLPLCSAEEAATRLPPAMAPFDTPVPSVTPRPTATINLTQTTATPTPTVTPPLPTFTSTANPATITMQADMTAAIISTQDALQVMTVTAIALTPPLNPDDKTLVGVGSHADVLSPPSWKVWHYQGTVGEVLTIKIIADPPISEKIGLTDTSFYLNALDGLVLTYANDFDPNNRADTVLRNYRLPATGIYTIEVHSAGLNTGGYTLTIESNGVQSSTAATATQAELFTVTQEGVGPTLTALQQSFEAQLTVTLTPSSTATATRLPPTATATSNVATQTAEREIYDLYQTATRVSNLLTATAQTFTPSPTPT